MVEKKLKKEKEPETAVVTVAKVSTDMPMQVLEIEPEQNKVGLPVDIYRGISCERFNDEIQNILAMPIDKNAVEIRPDGLIYFPGVEYRNILNKAFGRGAWAIFAKDIFFDKADNRVYYHGILFINGRFVSQSIGEQKYQPANENMSYATAVEGAKTDLIGRCCKDLGIANELWNPAFIREWRKENAISEWYTDLRKKGTGKDSVLLWRRKDQPQYEWPYEFKDSKKPPVRKPVEQKNPVDQVIPAVDKKPEKKVYSFAETCKLWQIWFKQKTGSDDVFNAIIGQSGFTNYAEITKDAEQKAIIAKMVEEKKTLVDKPAQEVLQPDEAAATEVKQ